MGKKASLFLMSLWLLIALSKQDAFDYIQVVHEWQPAMCNVGVKCKIEPENIFSIHGVWPSIYSKGQIGPCSGPPFDPLKIISLHDRMRQYWQDLVDGNNMAAWERKWAIHGTCSAAVFDVFEYFCMGLDSYGRHAVLLFLVHGGLVPSSAQLLSKTSFIKAIADITSKKGGVICAADYRGRTQLQKVIFCYNKDRASMIDCPSNVSNSCPDQFLWLALGD